MMFVRYGFTCIIYYIYCIYTMLYNITPICANFVRWTTFSLIKVYVWGVIKKFVDCLNQIKTPKDTMKFLTSYFRLHNKWGSILKILLLNYQRFCTQWYDQSAQHQSITFFQRVILISIIFLLIFILLRLSNSK